MMRWLVILVLLSACQSEQMTVTPATARPASTVGAPSATLALVQGLVVAGRGPKTGYRRTQFGPAWADVDHNGCDTRNDILRRDLTEITVRPGTHGCVVLTGLLHEPYSNKNLVFSKARASEVQIDHVVALSDAWQKGAAAWTPQRRQQFANDPLNLLAVDGRLNQQKGDGDTATWLPPYSRCPYVARQVAVKLRYQLHITQAERDAMVRVLKACSR